MAGSASGQRTLADGSGRRWGATWRHGWSVALPWLAVTRAKPLGPLPASLLNPGPSGVIPAGKAGQPMQVPLDAQALARMGK